MVVQWENPHCVGRVRDKPPKNHTTGFPSTVPEVLLAVRAVGLIGSAPLHAIPPDGVVVELERIGRRRHVISQVVVESAEGQVWGHDRSESRGARELPQHSVAVVGCADADRVLRPDVKSRDRFRSASGRDVWSAFPVRRRLLLVLHHELGRARRVGPCHREPVQAREHRQIAHIELEFPSRPHADPVDGCDSTPIGGQEPSPRRCRSSQQHPPWPAAPTSSPCRAFSTTSGTP